MWALLDVLRISGITIFSCISSPKKFPQRSWPSEFTFRLAKRLLQESVSKPIPWLRARQKILKLYSTDLLKVSLRKERIGGVNCLVILPKRMKQPDTVILYFHGGGYVVGSADGYSVTLAKLALASEAKVVAVEYRRAPDYPLPAAQEDCLAVTKAIIEVDKDKKLVLIGDSAGGGLCIATLNALRKANLDTVIAASVLISPWLTPIDSNTLERNHEVSDILDAAVLNHWVNSFDTGIDEHRALVDFSDIDVSKLPPIYIQAAGVEVFSKQIQCFIEKLKKANAHYRYDVFDEQFHVFQTFAPLVREADEALERVGAYVKHLASRGH